MARNGIDEVEALAVFPHFCVGQVYSRGMKIPMASQIHHRNKRNGVRLCKVEWWMSASHEEHEWVETHKDEARKQGLLLPISANPEGFTPSGERGVPTQELMALRGRQKALPNEEKPQF